MKRTARFALFALVTLFTAACSDDDGGNSNPGSLDYSYYPTNVGHELIYDARLITRDQIAGDDTSVFQVREVVESIFNDNQGRPTQRLERYTRATPNDPWVIADVWTSNMTSTRVEKKEENITYIKLVFPLLEGKDWDGHSLNSLGPQEYIYDWVDDPYTVNGTPFNRTLRVIQANEDNFVYKDFDEEIYAPGIGLAYRNQIYILYDRTTNPQVVGVKEQRLYSEILVSWSN